MQKNYHEIKKDAKQAVWIEMESVKYVWKKFTPSSERDYKNLHALRFINVYRNVISKASEIFDIPNMLLAGVAFQEYGGAPSFIDPLAYNTRIIVQKSSFLRETFEFITKSNGANKSKTKTSHTKKVC